MTDLLTGLVALVSLVAGAVFGRRQRRAATELTEAQADEITERIYGRIVERLQAEVDRLTDQVGTLELRVDELGRTLRTRTAELQAVRIERDHAIAELARVRAQLADRTARLDEARRRVACSSCPLATL